MKKLSNFNSFIMKKVYSEYFQKSKVFLYPLLNIKKGVKYVPAETYISWKGVHDEENLKFICLYAAEDTKNYRIFEQRYLLSHKLFEEYFFVILKIFKIRYGKPFKNC